MVGRFCSVQLEASPLYDELLTRLWGSGTLTYETYQGFEIEDFAISAFITFHLVYDSKSIGLFQLSDLLSERDQLRALLDNRTGTIQLEKDEVERSLNATRNDLLKEQRKNKDKMDSLETKVDELTSQLSNTTTEKETKTLELDSYRTKNHKLEQQLRELEKSKLQAIMVCYL